MHDSNERDSLDKIEFGVALHSLLRLLKTDLEKADANGDEDDD